MLGNSLRFYGHVVTSFIDIDEFAPCDTVVSLSYTGCVHTAYLAKLAHQSISVVCTRSLKANAKTPNTPLRSMCHANRFASMVECSVSSR